ncbi:hypothetical protein GCM10007242_12420 [Pigmentiphaga litoralis]|nr:hypothetical protein GCM10007242_12420 [Pigmentiphaga litoralis]
MSDRVQPGGIAQIAVPAVADRHVADLVPQNDVQDAGGRVVAGMGQSCPDCRAGVQATSFQRARHERHARQGIALGLFRHLPQAVVGRKVAVPHAMGSHVVGQQREMQGFLARDFQPILVEPLWQARKAPYSIQGQVDGVEFNMRERMHERSARLGRGHATRRHVARRHLDRLVRAARHPGGLG